jgi:hypothetical protein
MKIYQVKINGKSYTTTQPPMFVPGFVVLTLNERKSITFLSSEITTLEWRYIAKGDPNYAILKAKLEAK